jgi:CYTH domain-containing protein
MSIEIERKFLVKDTGFLKNYEGSYYIQGYLSSTSGRTVRVRVANNKGWLTIKGKAQNLTRPEYEYEVPLKDAAELLELCEKPLLEKIRYKIEYASKIWEVDVFLKDNTGLIVAEIELKTENEKFRLPSWVGKEVSGDKKYSNSNLIKVPYKDWK